ncbi:MAG: hypothetical protein WBB34_04260, partial [Xanthobacteraceae bacterium]
SAAGKSRASRNALRHGLAAITNRSSLPAGDVERLARAICGADDDSLLYGAAAAIAENHLLRRAIKAQQVAVVERLRERTAIAMAKGDNSLILAKARFLGAWLANREIEARVPKLLEKYKVEREDRDEVLPIALKALLEECKSNEEHERAQKIAENCLKQHERGDNEALEAAIPDLNRLERYGRRAWSRHKQAVREFINIKLMRRLEKDYSH